MTAFVAGLFVGACVALVVFALLTAGRSRNAFDRLLADYDPPFPPHDGQGPDVSPLTGDERITTDENGNPL